LCQQLVGVLFLFEVLFEQAHGIPMAQLLRPTDEGAVAGLIVLDGVRRTYHAGVEDRFIFDLIDLLVGLGQYAIDRIAFLAPRGSVNEFAYLIEAANLRLGFFAVGLEGLLSSGAPAFFTGSAFRVCFSA
jgi:hypothetical protein